MAGLTITSVTKRFGETEVLKGVTLDVTDAEFVSLVGPSGCGKSTLLRIIAGLEDPTSGEISIGGAAVTGMRAAERNLSMVFQSYALYPHLTVAENIAVPLRMRTLSRLQRLPFVGPLLPGARNKGAEIMSAVKDAAEMLEISALLDRKPGQLSGGQRQRVALGRALVRNPTAFLLDEPLSNLDAKLRVQTRAEIAQLHRRLNTTFIYVTHDQVEAMTMSDRIAVMMDGEILQCDAPSVIYEDPSDIRVAEFIGSPKINILPIELRDGALTLFGRSLGKVTDTPPSGVFQLGLRPEALRIAHSNPVLTGKVVHVENLGSEFYAQIVLDGQTTRVTLRAAPVERHNLGLGATIGLAFDLGETLIFDADGKRQRRVELAATQLFEAAEMAVVDSLATPRKAREVNRQARTAWVLTGPALALMVLILLIPVMVAGFLSFTNYSLGNSGFDWVGFENYDRLFSRSTYEKMFIATFTYVVVVVPISVALGLGAALLVNSLGRIGDVYKTIYFLPVMATLLAMAIVWEFMLHPTIGVINQTFAMSCDTFLEVIPFFANGCAEGFPLWLGDRDYAIWVLCFIGIWQGFGFNMVLYLAGLTAVHRELYHAAEMDGAKSAWERFRLVTWPALGPTTVFVVTISCIRAFQVFDTVEAFWPQGGGPNKSTYVMMFAIFEKGVQQNLIGIGSAITMLFLMFVMFLTLIQRWLIERKVHY